MPTSSHNSPWQLSCFCLAIAAFELLTYMASDLILPGMLTVTEQLSASPDHVPYAFTLYLAGGVLLQWLIGPLADHYGRRPLLLIGCALFALACAATYWVQGIAAFNGLRLIQGLGLGFVIAVSFRPCKHCSTKPTPCGSWRGWGTSPCFHPCLGPCSAACCCNG